MTLREAQAQVTRARSILFFEQQRVAKHTAAMVAATGDEARAEEALAEAEAQLEAVRREGVS